MKTKTNLLCVAICATAFVSQAAVSLTAKTVKSMTDVAADGNWSGITYAGQKSSGAHLFFLSREKSGVATTFGCASGATDGLLIQPLEVAFATDGAILTQSLGTKFAVTGVNDPEDLAYDPANDSVWIADEAAKSIAEYKFTDATRSALSPTYHAVPLPSWFTGNLQSDIGIQSVTISGDGLTLWTANDDALAGDGDKSITRGTASGPVIRLLKFTRETVDSAWVLAKTYAYQCDACASTGISALGYEYTACHSGVSSLIALPKGSASELLVLERNADTESVGRVRVYAPSFATATDVSDVESLASASYTLVTKGSSLGEYKDGSRANKTLGIYKDYDLVDYEGFCLGPRLENGSLAMLMASSGGLDFKYDVDITISTITFTIETKTYLRSFALNGVDAVRVNFAAVNGAPATLPHGANYLYLKGDTIACSAAVDKSPYATRYTYQWQDPAGKLSGSPTASYTVSAAGTYSLVAYTDESNPILAVDSFENVTVGTTPANWSAASIEPTVVTLTPTIGTPPGYPLAETTHTKVLSGTDGARRTYSDVPANCAVDGLYQVVRGKIKPSEEGMKVAVLFDMQGHPVIFTADAIGQQVESTIEDLTFAEGEWVRVSFTFDYTTDPSAGWVQIRINGSPLWTDMGVNAPGAGITALGGSWHRTLGERAPVSALVMIGPSAMDDIIVKALGTDVTEEKPFPITPAPGETEPTVGGVPVAWIEEQGLPWTPAAPIPGAVSTYSMADVYATGIDPYVDEELKITDIEIDATGKPVISTNGGVTNPNADLRIQSADTPVGPWSSTKTDGTFFRVKVGPDED